MRSLMVLAATCLLPTQQLQASSETRCGWLHNPSPANYWLSDDAGEWVLSTQGGHRANGFFDLPESAFSFGDQWVSTGASDYGYGCACVVGKFDKEEMHLRVIDQLRPKKLVHCEKDAKLGR